MEEAYGTHHKNSPAGQGSAPETSESDSSSEDEDDEGILASGTLDDEFAATLQAIKQKHPRVYNKDATFYSSKDNGQGPGDAATREDKPMFLSDYHRKHLLDGDRDPDVDNGSFTYQNQQDQMREELVRQIHAAEPGNNSAVRTEDDFEDDEGLLKIKHPVHVERTEVPISANDVEQAEQNPDDFLSRFVAARAWIPKLSPEAYRFESDDDEYDREAEEFEEAYNMRFEDPARANERITTHARDAAAKFSVRPKPTTQRGRAREAERVQKSRTKSKQLQEKTMLRKLRLEEAEEKLKQIADAAGITGTTANMEDWTHILSEDWDDATWESEMRAKFGEEYYTRRDPLNDAGARDSLSSRPHWESEIDIHDIVPDFKNEEHATFSVSDEESGEGDSRRRRSIKQAGGRHEKKEARRQRRKLQQLVDEKIKLDTAFESAGSKSGGRFRYRATSPLSFGMTARDILIASDSQLNQFAGLKKMATFRDAQKRRQDIKKLGKKARLRQWRRETFGDESGPRPSLHDALGGEDKGGAFERAETEGAVAETFPSEDQLKSKGSRRSRKRKRREETVG